MSEAAVAAQFSRLLSDEHLTRRAVSGDERAFAAIFRRYHQSLYRFCLAIVGNPEDAQDALQNTMIKVLGALPGEERRIELKPWLYRIAHNESIDLLRRRRETRELDVEQVAPGYGLAEDVAMRERLRRLLVDLRELPDRQREVLVMREMAGLDFDEIGVALETTGAVARQTLYEARQSLRQMEEGREMDCDAVTRALSEGDGRVVRRRDVRAHLRSCTSCREFRDEIGSRRQDLAALAPLPTVAAVAMLQGLVGGGSQVATGGGLAAVLGGGAAKTVASSAAVKGLATVAVVAAVGVTAADRTGVIHLGLPGEQSARSPATPGAAGAHSHEGSSGVDAGAAAQGLNGNASPKGVAGSGGDPAAGVHGKGRAAEHSQDKGNGGSQGSPGEHASGRGHEKQHPPAAAGGRETAAENKSPAHEANGNKGGASEAAPPSRPSHPSASDPPVPPPKEPPANPPRGAAPTLPPQANSPTPPAKEAEPPAAGSPSNPGAGAEKKPQAAEAG